MPKLSRPIHKRIEGRPFWEKQQVAREAYHDERLSEQGRKGGRASKANQGARLLAADLAKKHRDKSFPAKWETISDDEADPYTIRKDGKIYEFWREGDWLQISTSTDPDREGRNGRGRRIEAYREPIKKVSFKRYVRKAEG